MIAILLAVLGLVTALFALGSILGAPFLPTRKADLELPFKLLDLKPGQTLVDLGAGSGTILVGAAQRGIKAVGYEINPIMWLIAYLKTRPYRSLVDLRWGNYWQQPLPACDGIYVFLITKYMGRLDQKLSAELTQPTLVVSLGFKLPGKRILDRAGHFYLYRYP